MDDLPAFIIRRIPLAALYRNRVILGLACSQCGHSFVTDYNGGGFEGRIGSCPKCGARQKLRPADLRRVLERSFRAAAARVEKHGVMFWRDALAFTIANAAQILEPILMVVVVHFMHQFFGHYYYNTHNFLRRLKKNGWSEALLFAMPPNPKTESNHWLGRKWAERFIVTPAAVQAFHELENRGMDAAEKTRSEWRRRWDSTSYQGGDFLYRCLATSTWYDYSKPEHAVDLFGWQDFNKRYMHWWGYHDYDLAGTENVPPFAFSEAEHARADRHYAEMGLTRDDRFVCFSGRDNAFFDAAIGVEWRRHEIKNMDIDTYLPAMNWLVDRGVKCLRMGRLVEKGLNTDRKGIIDYAKNHHDEFMDIYLPAHCLVSVSTSSGIEYPAQAMNNWSLGVNYPMPYACWGSFHHPKFCFMFKRIWDHRERRFLSLKELWTRRVGFMLHLIDYHQNGLSLVDNTADEILDGVREVYARATGAWTVCDEEWEMKEKFLFALRQAYPGYTITMAANMCYSFLKRHPYLLLDV